MEDLDWQSEDLAAISEKIRAAFDDEATIPLLPVSTWRRTTWLDGGCWPAGEAILKWLGGGALYGVFTQGESYEVVDHVVVRVGPYFLDARGVSLADEQVARNLVSMGFEPDDKDEDVFLGPVTWDMLDEDTLLPGKDRAIGRMTKRLSFELAGKKVFKVLVAHAAERAIPEGLMRMPENRLTGELDDRVEPGRKVWLRELD